MLAPTPMITALSPPARGAYNLLYAACAAGVRRVAVVSCIDMFEWYDDRGALSHWQGRV